MHFHAEFKKKQNCGGNIHRSLLFPQGTLSVQDVWEGLDPGGSMLCILYLQGFF